MAKAVLWKVSWPVDGAGEAESQPSAAFAQYALAVVVLLGITLGAFLLAVLGQLMARTREQEKTVRLREQETRELYLLAGELATAGSLGQLVQNAGREIDRVFGAQVAFLFPNAQGKLSYEPHPASTYDISGPEQPVAESAFQTGQVSGRFVHHEAQVEAVFLPLSPGRATTGVMAVRFSPALALLTPRERSLLQHFAQQIALALDRHQLIELAGKSKLLAESERLSKNLLNCMSHEVRTPLTAIKTATGELVELRGSAVGVTERALLREVEMATERLDRLIGKVLEVSRLESGFAKPNFAPCDPAELVNLVVKEARQELAGHKLTVTLAPGLPLVLMDFVLMQQALANLLSNAAIHTPPGTPVMVRSRVEDDSLVISVADQGPGLEPASQGRVFEKFYRGRSAPTGGTGLGLSLVKGFVEAQGGQVQAGPNPGGGALFTVRLPLRTETGAAAPGPADVSATPAASF